MKVLSYSEVRANLKQAIDDVCSDHEPTIIKRQSGDSAVLISLDDYNSMQETVGLLSSPANAERLMRGVKQVEAGRARIRAFNGVA